MRQDSARLAELRRALILDSGPERAYDEITRLLASGLAVPITMVNLLDAERDWFKSCVGIQQTQSPVVTSFCEAFFNSTHDVIVVEDTLLDARFAAHPLVSGRPFVRFYAAARLIVNDQTIGTVCAYDIQPRTLTPDKLENLQSLASAAVELIAKRYSVAERSPSRDTPRD